MAEGGGGIDWKALSVDKAIDAVLIPVGLFLALWFQGWVDGKKEKEDYAALIGDFHREVSTNKGKLGVLESDLGPISELEPDKVLGPLQAKFDEFKADTERLSSQFDCIDLFFELSLKAPSLAATPALPAPAAPAPAAPAPTPAQPAPAAEAPAAEAAPEEALPDRKSAEAAADLGEDQAAQLAACNALMDAAEKEKPKRFPGVDLSPFYEYVVWQVYLQNGIKLFKDSEAKQLGLILGEVYASQREVEKRLEEIARLFNDSLMKSSGELAALVAEAGELLPEEPSAEDLKEAQPRIKEMSQEAFEVRYEIENVRSVVALKVTRLKEYLVKTSERLDLAVKALATEQLRVGKAP
ncbi:MAG: hypothetical protein JNJ59_24440 [Deltaproteobacteria bacterium]|nr:hypothetical protein [Deltaproteobacteria bacterium]